MKPGRIHRHSGGFTLVEVVVAIIIVAILVAVAMRSGKPIADTARSEETKAEMEALAFAVAGNPELRNSAGRADFGYVGDVGALPPNLDALMTNPGGYTTWKGPYISRRFFQITDDYKTDAWGATYSLNGVSITSTGSGANIVKKVAPSSSDLLYNPVSGLVLDRKRLAPGTVYRDSISVRLTIPDGLGGSTVKTATPDASGYFSIDSVPIGAQELKVIYMPTADTLAQFVSVTPSSSVYTECVFRQSLFLTSGGLVLVPSSDSVYGSQCQNVRFWVTNTSTSPRTVTTIKVTWPSPTAYYGRIRFGGTTVFNQGGSPRGVSGTTYTLSSAQTINPGQSVRIRITDFRANNTPGGGPRVSMSNVTLSIEFSDGSSFSEVFPSCP
ncbi:MAG: prepilin-type N-terminal cleavage/methylation domain-containing protein [Candidatus Zixiibacteriota bacterium]